MTADNVLQFPRRLDAETRRAQVPRHDADMQMIAAHLLLDECERAVVGREVVPMPARCTQYFGGCPVCGQSDYHNVGRNHWGCCADHKTRWWIGSNLFSDWHDETEVDWARNEKILADYREVEPLREGAIIPHPPGRAA